MMTKNSTSRYDACVIGGAGHVGAPLAILLATHGVRTLIHDVNRGTMARLAAGDMPFTEEGAVPLLKRALAENMLGFSTDAADVEGIPYLIVTIGTPVDEFHNPVLRVVTDCLDALVPFISDDQTIVMRSTVFPGVTDYLDKYLQGHGKRPRIAFCPERVVQGFAIKEMQELPQIISGTTPEATRSAAELFGQIAPKLVYLTSREAEFAKLVCNAYRYIEFAAVNQFYMIAHSAGLDFARIVDGLKEDYPRMRSFPRPGFAAGPCLYKDTLQLAAFAKQEFNLGAASIQANEGLPNYIVEMLAAEGALETRTVGLLGMAFKADCDDRRASLSYKLKKILQFRAGRVMTTDPHVTDDPDLLPVDEVIAASDTLVLCAPHSCYADLDLRGKPVIDVWNFFAARGRAAAKSEAAHAAPRALPGAQSALPELLKL